jgi:membrane associated rhomboid family serine protease
MSRWDESGNVSWGGFPRPGKALKWVMIGLLAIWLLFAIAINWGGASESLFLTFCGNTGLILRGEVWRLFTAPLMHLPSGSVSHILFMLLGLYFLTPTLEQRWGSARLLRFLFFSGVLAYGFQLLFELLLPASLASKLVGQWWFGAAPILEAIAIAFALNFRGSTVRLMFVLPVTATGLVVFVVGMSVLRLIAASQTPEGLISPFGGMLAGWLLGGGTPSPLRRLYLRFRLKQLDRQVEVDRKARARRAKDAPFKVIEGGRTNGSDGKTPDGRWFH